MPAHVSRSSGDGSQGNGTLGYHGIQRSTGRFDTQNDWRLLPLIRCLLDQELGYHSIRSSYQEEDSDGLFPCLTGGQGERELYPRIQRHKHY